MVLDWMNITINTLKAEPQWLMALIFLVAFIEAFALVGVVVPGIVILFGLSLAIGLDPGLFFGAWVAASLGAFLGDASSFGLGRRWQPARHGELVARAQALFQRHGGKSIFIGRFIGPVRPVIPLVGGMLGVRWSTFLSFAVPACLLWAPVYLVPGMIFGASLEMAAAMAGRLAAVMVLVVMGTWFGLWLVRLVYGLTARKSSWWIKRWVQWTHRHRILGRWVRDLTRPGSREVVAMAFLGLVLAISLSALIVLLLLAPTLLPQWSVPFHPATWATSLRNEWADPIFVTASLISDAWVMGMLIVVITLALLAARRFVAMGHWLVAVVGVWALAWGIDGLMDLLLKQPPPASVAHASLTDVPHPGFALLVTAVGFFALMVAKDLNARARKWPYVLSALVLIPIGFAHFYLELASILGLGTALALGMGWSALVGMGYRHRARVRPFPFGLLAVFLSAWVVLAGVQINAQYTTRLQASEVPLNVQLMGQHQWLEGGWQTLPDRRSLLGPEISQAIDFQLAASLADESSEGEQTKVDQTKGLIGRLEDQGWVRVPPITWRGLINGLSQRPLHWPRALNGRSEALLMTRTDQVNRNVEVLRLWASGLVIETDQESLLKPVWLGQMRGVQMEQGFWGLMRWVDEAGSAPLNEFSQSFSDQAFIRVPYPSSPALDPTQSVIRSSRSSGL